MGSWYVRYLCMCVCVKKRIVGIKRDMPHERECVSAVFVRQRQIKRLSEGGSNKKEFVLGNISAGVALSGHQWQLPFQFFFMRFAC